MQEQTSERPDKQTAEKSASVNSNQSETSSRGGNSTNEAIPKASSSFELVS